MRSRDLTGTSSSEAVGVLPNYVINRLGAAKPVVFVGYVAYGSPRPSVDCTGRSVRKGCVISLDVVYHLLVVLLQFVLKIMIIRVID